MKPDAFSFGGFGCYWGYFFDPPQRRSVDDSMNKWPESGWRLNDRIRSAIPRNVCRQLCYCHQILAATEKSGQLVNNSQIPLMMESICVPSKTNNYVTGQFGNSNCTSCMIPKRQFFHFSQTWSILKTLASEWAGFNFQYLFSIVL